MSVELLTEPHLELLSIKGGCTGSSECIFVKTPCCWKSRVITAQYVLMLMTSTTETYFNCLSNQNKVIDIIKFEKHFLNSTTHTQS